MNNITIGADTEFFLIGKNGKPMSSVGLIGGTKKDPIKISNILKTTDFDDFMIQEDNVLAEINVPVAHDQLEFNKILSRKFNLIDLIIKHFNKSAALSMALKSHYLLDDDQLTTEQSQVFGCDPDFNAWTGKMNESPKIETNLRTAGYHIHIGYENSTMEKNIEIIKFMDLIFGSSSFFSGTQELRQFLYGKIGAFRHKPYGVEYRFLNSGYFYRFYNSNFYSIAFDVIKTIVHLVSVENKTVYDFIDKRLLNKIILAIAMNSKEYSSTPFDIFSTGDFPSSINKIYNNAKLSNYIKI